MLIDASKHEFGSLNRIIAEQSEPDIQIVNCLGQRFIGAGAGSRSIKISGVPGNALGAYLNGAEIEVCGNAQDSVGDTMNDGRIIIRGCAGDAAGYAMRGGRLYIRGNTGYRAGVHMKSYRDRCPVLIVGGRAGSFLGEYQAGGIIIVLGLNTDGKPIVSNFPCAGMHGGRMYLRGDCGGVLFPPQVSSRPAGSADIDEIRPFLSEFCSIFGLDPETVLSSPFTLVTPDSSNPYRQMYVSN